MRVFVYYNLHKKCWSVRSVESGRVICHRSVIHLLDPVFKVSEAGRARVLREGRKNVHAGVQGVMISRAEYLKHDGKIAGVRYNPYETSTFIDMIEKTPIKKADAAEMVCYTTGPKVVAVNPCG